MKTVMNYELQVTSFRKHSLFTFHFSLFTFLLVCSACATAPKLPPSPPKYVHEEKVGQSLSKSNSLWHDTASLYEDIKARRLNDLVTINVVESIAGSGKADTAAGRDSTLSAGIDSLFGVPLDLNIKNLYGSGNAFSPTVKGSMKNDFKGTGETTREGSLIGTITAKVVEVMPNNNLVLESRKEITINNEKQILVLRGIIRPDDISIGNTVLSNRVTDAEIYFVGDGILQDKQRQGWLGRILDKIWPF
jgi:flagellar L-ring protein precursor FlgH